jgi:nucleoside-diphosphate-sugar epimerase
MLSAVLVLGCGYTGARVARRLRARGLAVHATSRDPGALTELAACGAAVHALDVRDPASLAALGRLAAALPAPCGVLHSVPLVAEQGREVDPTPRLTAALGDRPARLVYLSTTSVYGALAVVDEHTPPAPRLPREQLRLDAERAAAAGPWSALALRSAAIYGPGRGVHVAVRTGQFRFAGAGRHVLSRIYVDDLAAIVEAALLADVTGAFPVADDEPAVSAAVAAFAARLMGLPATTPAAAPERTGPGHVERRVDGRAIRRLLGVTLRYPSYRVGIPAALTEEATNARK